MIQWLRKKYSLPASDNSGKLELEEMRKKVEDLREKYHKDKEMDVSSDSDEEIDPEEQKRIDEEMKKQQQKKKRNAY